MGKYAKDKRLYRKEWETMPWATGWLEHIDQARNKYNTLNEAHCRLCNTSIRAHISDLQKHAQCLKHRRAAAKINIPPKNTLAQHGIGCSGASRESKINDIKLSVYIATHSAIRSIDHLSELLKSMSKGSDLDNVKIHRTKCTSIIRYVVAPAILNQLVNNIGPEGYSLIVDESTDVSVVKYMCLCVRYFNRIQYKVVSDFLAILEMERATATDLYTLVTEYLQEINLPIKNMIDLGTDGASNLCGVNRSLYTLLKEDVPNLQLIKCVCHSLHLCASKASEELPSSLEYLVREIYNWFNISPLRRIEYKRTFDAINTGFDSKKFHQLVQLSKTRWLAFYQAVKRLLEQWLELKTHFNIVSQNEKCYTARTISNMLNDDTIRLYFMFIKPILQVVDHLNILFQSEGVDIGSAYKDMYLTFLSLARKLLKPAFLVERDNKPLLEQVCDALSNDLAYLSIEDTDFGAEFEQNLQECNIPPSEAITLKKRCFNFLKSLLEQMALRLPTNMKMFKCFHLLHPSSCLATNQVKFINLNINNFFYKNVSWAEYENQWQKLPFVDWTTYFNNNIPNNVLEFWPEVYKFTDAAGRYIFKDLATAVLKMLSMPISNATVERVFSVMNLTKTKTRNKLHRKSLEALLRIKIHFIANKKCCQSFEPTGEMLKNFNSKIMYEYNAKDGGTDEDNNTEIEMEMFDAVNELF